jgi:hypothetical protein
MAEPVPVKVRDCTCPGSPHSDGDVVYLPPTIGLDAGLEAEQAMFDLDTTHPVRPDLAEQAKAGDARAVAELEAIGGRRLVALRPKWFPLFVRQAFGWNVVDQDGERVPFDIDTILADYTAARAVADAAADLYQGPLFAPFMTPPPKPSPNGRTASGTHPPTEPTPLRSRSSSAANGRGRRSAVNR